MPDFSGIQHAETDLYYFYYYSHTRYNWSHPILIQVVGRNDNLLLRQACASVTAITKQLGTVRLFMSVFGLCLVGEIYCKGELKWQWPQYEHWDLVGVPDIDGLLSIFFLPQGIRTQVVLLILLWGR